MAYIGTEPIVGQYRKLDDISGSFNGSTTTFNLTVTTAPVTAGTAQQLLVSLGGVIQNPNIDYTVSTNTITFTTAPASGLSFFGVLMGDTLNVGTPSDGTVTSAKLASDLTIDLASGTVSAPSLSFDSNTGFYSTADNEVAITTDGTYRAKVDSSGRLLVGTSTSRNNFFNLTTYNPRLQIEGTDFASSMASVVCNSTSENSFLIIGRTRGTSVGSNTAINSGDSLGVLSFQGSDGSELVEAARIETYVDATPGANDMPGRLTFMVTADGSSSPTEALRISNDRSIAVTQTPGKYSISTSEGATSIANNGTVDFTSFSGFILANNYTSGAVQCWLVGGGTVVSVSSTGAVGSLAYNAGVSGYRWTNNSGSTATFGFFCIRTRPNA